MRFKAALLVLFVTACLLIAWSGRGDQAATAGKNELQFVHNLLQTAKRCAETREQAGKALLAILGDEKQPTSVRGECARALGKLRYRPAITKLIELIDLEDHRTKGFAEIPHPKEFLPCWAALSDYGMDALPAVVEACVAEKNERRRLSLGVLLHDGGVAKEASIYAQGLAMDRGDQQTIDKVLVLIRDLSTVDRRVTWPPKLLKPANP